jgi:hypothetical protein
MDKKDKELVKKGVVRIVTGFFVELFRAIFRKPKRKP